ncbi:microfibril-associated glycoprotein 4-like [Saccostrea cucullata]|uniref:microfibril-associated glycoprotein 4-like n=1 Tax=Saccostrea cuccullata TaxID=36930 RepID=UPI002ED6B0CC
MSNLLAVFLIAAYFTVPLAAMFSWRFVRSVDFDDKKSEHELLGEYSIAFKDCAEKCRGDFLPRDCKELLDNDYTYTGVYDVYPYGISSIPVKVFCDMSTMGGGWTGIQKRMDGSVTFDRNWIDYKNGFGSSEAEVWIGHDVLHQLTKENSSSLYVSITLQNGTTLYEMYDGFSVSNEAGKYQLFLTGPATGTLGDSMIDTGYPYHDLSGMSFSTPDRDNDRHSDNNCAAASSRRGGWWFNSCHRAFLNGVWSSESWHWPWDPTVRSGKSVKGTTMMVRRH